MILSSSATLIGRSLWNILQIKPGYGASRAVVFRLALPPAAYPDAAAHNAFYARVLERISVLPGVSATGVTGALPLTGTPATTMEPEPNGSNEQLSADVITASPGFFEALRIPLRRGRLFTPSDTTGAPAVAVINDAAARRFWPDGTSPLGREITMKDWGAPIGRRSSALSATFTRAARRLLFHPRSITRSRSSRRRRSATSSSFARPEMSARRLPPSEMRSARSIRISRSRGRERWTMSLPDRSLSGDSRCC